MTRQLAILGINTSARVGYLAGADTDAHVSQAP
jgi:hypothetical protein